MPSQFRISLFGYDRKQVNNFITDKASEYEEAHAARQERLISMRDQNSAIKADLEKYKRMEGDISSALITARQKANELIAQCTREAVREREILYVEIDKLQRLTMALNNDMENTMLEYERQMVKITYEMEQRIAANRERLTALLEQKEAFLRESFTLLDGKEAV